ncbi:MAG TPA: RDD family protein [Cellulomonas sp.]
MSDQRCAACGGVLERDAVFCGSCGARVTTLAAPSAPPASLVPPASAALPADAALPAAWSLGADVDEAVAPIGRRLLALLVDQVLAALVVGAGVLAVLPALHDGGADAPLATILVPGMLAVLLAAGQWLAEAFAGCTLGSALLGIRTVSARTGRPAGLWAVLVRSVVQALGSLLAGVGVYLVAASGAWDEGPEQRGWHDKAARTMVLRAAYLSGRRGRRDPADTGESAAPDPRSGAVAAGGLVPVPSPGPTPGPPVPVPPVPVPPVVPTPTVPPAVTSDPGAPPARATALPAQPGPVQVAASSPGPEPAPDPDAPTTRTTDPVTSDSPSARDPLAVVPEPEVPARSTATPVLPAVTPGPAAGAPSHPLPAASGRDGGADAGDDLPDLTVPTVPLPGGLEHTRVGGWAPRAGVTGPDVPLRLLFDTGEQIDVRGPGLVGRRPVPGEDVWVHLVAVDDPDQSVSKTHLAFRPDCAGLVVTDRGSTNGTVLIDPAGSRWVLPPDEPALVAAGWSLVLGQRTVRVEAR